MKIFSCDAAFWELDDDDGARLKQVCAENTCVVIIVASSTYSHIRFTPREIPPVRVYTGFWYYYRKKHKPPEGYRSLSAESFRYSPTNPLPHRCLCHACERPAPRRDAPALDPNPLCFGVFNDFPECIRSLHPHFDSISVCAADFQSVCQHSSVGSLGRRSRCSRTPYL